MAKTIKFNLILDEQPIRDIKGLQENFCIDDILDFYKNRLLQKWLKVRGFDEYLKKIESIKKDESITIQLIKIFNIEKSEKEIKEAVYSLMFWDERKQKLEKWNKKDIKIKEVIANYHNGYDDLMAQIIKNKEDMPFLKTATKEIFDNYLEVFKLDYRSFFHKFQEDGQLMIYAVLMNNNLRDFFLEDKSLKKILQLKYALNGASTHLESGSGSASWLEMMAVMFDGDNEDHNADDLKRLRDKTNICMFKGETDGYWKDLETKKTKVMVLSIPDDSLIRNAAKLKEEISAEEVNGNFLMLDGLAYKSNSDCESIVYMEV